MRVGRKDLHLVGFLGILQKLGSRVVHDRVHQVWGDLDQRLQHKGAQVQERVPLPGQA